MMHYIRIYDSWKKETAALTDEEKGRLMDELIDYLVTGQERMPEGNERFLYPTLIDRIQRENETHERRIEERKAGKIV